MELIECLNTVIETIWWTNILWSNKLMSQNTVFETNGAVKSLGLKRDSDGFNYVFKVSFNHRHLVSILVSIIKYCFKIMLINRNVISKIVIITLIWSIHWFQLLLYGPHFGFNHSSSFSIIQIYLKSFYDCKVSSVPSMDKFESTFVF